jgi:NAD(P) transhydrogenase subunit alpha
VSAFDIRPEVKEQIESLGATFVEERAEGEGTAATRALPARQAPRDGLAGLWDELKLGLGMAPGESEADGGAAEEATQEADAEHDSTQTGGYAREQAEDKQRRDREVIKTRLEDTDVVITTALVPGKRAPILLTTDMVEAMPPGSVVVDLAAEAGGNCELTCAGETVEHGEVRIIGPRDIPSGMPIHASQLYSRNVVNLLSHLVEDGELELDFDDEITDGAVVCHGGEVCHEGARDALGQTEKAEA